MKKINTIFDIRNTFRVKNLDETIKKLTDELACLDTFGGTQTLPLRIGNKQMPLSMASTELSRMSNPERSRMG